MLYNECCFRVFQKIEPKSIDLVLVDLPYGQTDCNWDTSIDLERMWESLTLICKPCCQYIFFATTKFGNTLINSNPKSFRYDLVWEKTKPVGFLHAKRQPLRSHEMIYIFRTTGSPVYNPQKNPGKPYKERTVTKGTCYKYKTYETIKANPTGEKHPTSVLHYSMRDKRIHATQKPLDLCEFLVKSYSNEGDVVLDFCMGSGTTIVACIQNNRSYIGVERDKDIYDLAVERINQTLRSPPRDECED